MAVRTAPPAPKARQVDEAMVVRMADVYTPAEGYTGIRRRIRFTAGHAQIPDPRPEDFNTQAEWLAEHEAFEQLVNQFKMDGYSVKMRRAVVETEDEDEDYDADR